MNENEEFDKFERDLNEQINLDIRKTDPNNKSQDDFFFSNNKQSLILYSETKKEMFEVQLFYKYKNCLETKTKLDFTS
jgi:hypothetical protein